MKNELFEGVDGSTIPEVRKVYLNFLQNKMGIIPSIVNREVVEPSYLPIRKVSKNEWRRLKRWFNKEFPKVEPL